MNFVTILGRLGRDAESRFTPNGDKVTTLIIASTGRKSGKEETIWWRITLWGDRFDKMLSYLKKGSSIIVTGEITNKPDIYTDKEGTARVSSLDVRAETIRFSPWGKGGDGSSSNKTEEKQGEHTSGQPAQEFATSAATTTAPAMDFEEENIPF